MTEENLAVDLAGKFSNRFQDGIGSGRLMLRRSDSIDPRELAKDLQVSRHTIDVGLYSVRDKGVVDYNDSQVRLLRKPRKRPQLPADALSQIFPLVFTASEVRIDVFSLSGETFLANFLPWIRAMQGNFQHLQSIRIRFLISDLTNPDLKYPEDPKTRIKVYNLVRTQLASLSQELDRLQKGCKSELEVRTIPTATSEKGILFNETHLLMGAYTKKNILINGTLKSDVFGHGCPLVHLSKLEDWDPVDREMRSFIDRYSSATVMDWRR